MDYHSICGGDNQYYELIVLKKVFSSFFFHEIKIYLAELLLLLKNSFCRTRTSRRS